MTMHYFYLMHIHITVHCILNNDIIFKAFVQSFVDYIFACFNVIFVFKTNTVYDIIFSTVD